jgi:hypothetical protein
MSLPFRKRIRGRIDLNTQYSSANIGTVLRQYRSLPHDALGNYQFGLLSAIFFQLDANETQAWEAEIAANYPKDVEDEIRRHIVYALNHKGSDGQDSPIPIKWKFSDGARPAVNVSYNPRAPGGPMYTIEIVGFPSPALRAARKKK